MAWFSLNIQNPSSMDKLPESLLLEILSRLDNSADVARCRFASKAFNNVFPDLRSINLLCSWRGTSGSISSSCFKKGFLDFISKLRVVESVCISLHDAIGVDPVDAGFLMEWLPRVSQTLKLLSFVDGPAAFTAKKFENLKTLWLESFYIGFLLSEFPTMKTVETLILDSRNIAPRDARDSKLTLGKVFMVFPNLSSLRINSGAWSELEACLDPQGWEILDESKGLKTIYAYLMLVDPSLTFSYVACLLDQCVGLSVVSLLIHCGVDSTQCKSFRSKEYIEGPYHLFCALDLSIIPSTVE
ncbi:putative leucine-rich repeat domain superfamily, F-box-like domain superfamily [Helianthus anomalus]